MPLALPRVAVAGGGYSGCTAELDAVVAEAAQVLAAAYGQDVEIRFNSDRESGSAWLKTADGRNGRAGIAASLVTARHRAQSAKPRIRGPIDRRHNQPPAAWAVPLSLQQKA